jgi:hypothetical protein
MWNCVLWDYIYQEQQSTHNMSKTDAMILNYVDLRGIKGKIELTD